MSRLSEFGSVLVQLGVELVGLGSGKSDVFLGLLDFSSESSDLVVSLLHENVESFNLLTHYLVSVVALSLQLLPSAFSLSKLFLVLIQLSANCFELSLQFGQSSS